jgi:hypothetical protein
VAALLGLTPPATSEGSALFGPASVGARPIGYFQYADLHRGIRTTDHFKLIGYRLTSPGTAFDRLQLFDLESDPEEITDLSTSPAYQDKLLDLLDALAAERTRFDDPLLQ